ncbi:MAG: transcription antitermination factor NusB [Actinobacteria bacterium]|nr:transcription antitermination factor NusB [Actinomycetota bacterium]
MSRGTPASVIPARLTVAELAQAIGAHTDAVAAALEERREPSSPSDLVSGDLAVSVAAALGCEIVVEPRDLALEHLYELETGGEGTESPEGRAGRLSQGVAAKLDALDEMIEKVSEHWSVSRMSLIDRNVIRIALFELLEDPETPTGVIVSEAVRLAQTYSTERSGPFVNGVLATLARAVRS